MKQIALAFPMGVSHLERVAYGIRRFNRENPNWLLVTNPERHHLELEQLRNWQGDGVIGFINTAAEAEIIKQLNIPAINLSGALEKSPLPRVRVDYYKMGCMGAEHLIARGFDDLAFYGVQGVWYAEEICRGFRDTAEENDKTLHQYNAQSTLAGTWSGADKKLLDWLSSLPKPTGLMAAHDPRALEVLQACLQLSIRVPEDLALLGVNNDTITCELAQPTLSSIPRDGETVGYSAAALLHKIISGQVKAESIKEDIVIEPLSIIDRGSSAYLALKDPDLLSAVAYIRKNVDKQINVNSICQFTSKSRRWLEYTFKKELALSPLEFITKVRLSKAKEILQEEGSYKLSAVAHMAGFSSTDQMNKAFRKAYGKTAKDFKKS